MTDAEKYYSSLLSRCGENGYIGYFTAADFDGLRGERVTFPSGENVIAGYFYTNASPDDISLRSELVVFCHGLGGGHRSYMTEIDVLCRRGYTVFAFDCAGCFESSGDTTVALSNTLNDLSSALVYLRESGTLAGYSRLHLIGHSAGGFAVAAAAGHFDGIDTVTAISPYYSPETYIRAVTHAAGRDSLFDEVCGLERKASPDTFARTAADGIGKGGTRFLFAHSTDDATVPFADNTGYLMSLAGDRASFLICDGKGHNPNYTADAVAYMGEIFTAFNAHLGDLPTVEAKREYLADVDWRRMTAQDAIFWGKVFDFMQGE